MFKIVLSKSAEKSFAKLPSNIQNSCAEIFHELECSPTPIRLDVKKLKGYQDVYQIRVSGWRIIYRFDKKSDLIQIYDILPRKTAY
ncbi:MAG: type II toxin-antitoxin system RelE/ParE family toxin [Methanosarcinaceae archaeon]|nr:type II toxin-antitoxin system RelE/ParE family toxin [Methanosarcinaceae archaeon]